MGLKILHNPRCSKSRQTLAILSDNGIDVDIIEYLKDVPSEKTLRQIINILGIKPRDLLRKGEVVYKENNLRREDLTDDDLIQFMLDKGISSNSIAKNCGTSTAMIDKFYTANSTVEGMLDTFLMTGRVKLKAV